jgi:tetratricopeptide (TPR) repeat protein
MAIGEIVDLAFDESGDLLTADAVNVQLWRIRESAPGAGPLTVGPPEHVTRNLNLSRMACSADGRVLGLARSNGRAVIVDRASPQAAVELTSRANVFSIALTPDGSTAATAYTNGDLVQICDARNGKLIKELPTASSSVVFSPDGHRLLTSTDVLELWSVDDWKLLWKGNGSSIAAHAFFPGGRFFAGGVQTGQIVIYSTADGHVAARLDDPTSAMMQFLVIAPDARSLVGLYRDLHQFSTWDLDSLGHRLSRAGLRFELTEPGQREPVDGAAPLVVDIRLQDAHQPIEEELVSIRRDLEHQPGNAALLFRLGSQLSKLGCDTEARDALAGAVGNGNSFVPSIELAACEIRLGHWREGLARFEHALANPSLAPVQLAGLCNQIAWYLNLAPPDDRDPRKAVEYAQRALEFDPEGFHFLTILGMALYRQGELPLAIETLRHSLKNSPHPIFDLYGLALCYQAAGDQTRAADFRSRADYLFELRAESLESQRRVELQGLREEYQRALSPSLE